MSIELPPALRSAVEALIEGAGAGHLAERSAALSQAYRTGRNSTAALAGRDDLLAYLATRMPATYAATRAALSALSARLPDLAPASLLDAGAGPGTASWAAVEVWPRLGAVAMLEPHAGAAELARDLARASSSPALAAARIDRAHLPEALTEQPAADLVVASYVLGELPAAGLEAVGAALWQRTRRALVLVEPGTPAGFARLRICRDWLIAAGAAIAAPCAGAGPCPIAAPDWCHFAVRLARNRTHLRAKRASVPWEDERYCYLAATRLPLPGPAPARIIAPVAVGKPAVALRLCTDVGLAERVVARRSDPAGYKAARKLGWGDTV